MPSTRVPCGTAAVQERSTPRRFGGTRRDADELCGHCRCGLQSCNHLCFPTSPTRPPPAPAQPTFIFISSRSQRIMNSSCTSCCWNASALSQPNEEVRSLVEIAAPPLMNCSCGRCGQAGARQATGCEGRGARATAQHSYPTTPHHSIPFQARPSFYLEPHKALSRTHLVEHALQRQRHATGGLRVLRGRHVEYRLAGGEARRQAIHRLGTREGGRGGEGLEAHADQLSQAGRATISTVPPF